MTLVTKMSPEAWSLLGLCLTNALGGFLIAECQLEGSKLGL